MSRSSVVVLVFVIGGFAALLALVPGSPVWRMFRPAVALEIPSDPATGQPPRSLDIVTLLPRDAIPAILEPRFITAEDAQLQMSPTDRVIGVSINGEHRAYSTAHLSSHEVVNDSVGGRAIAVTW